MSNIVIGIYDIIFLYWYHIYILMWVFMMSTIGPLQIAPNWYLYLRLVKNQPILLAIGEISRPLVHPDLLPHFSFNVNFSNFVIKWSLKSNICSSKIRNSEKSLPAFPFLHLRIIFLKTCFLPFQILAAKLIIFQSRFVQFPTIFWSNSLEEFPTSCESKNEKKCVRGNIYFEVKLFKSIFHLTPMYNQYLTELSSKFR